MNIPFCQNSESTPLPLCALTWCKSFFKVSSSSTPSVSSGKKLTGNCITWTESNLLTILISKLKILNLKLSCWHWSPSWSADKSRWIKENQTMLLLPQTNLNRIKGSPGSITLSAMRLQSHRKRQQQISQKNHLTQSQNYQIHHSTTSQNGTTHHLWTTQHPNSKHLQVQTISH